MTRLSKSKILSGLQCPRRLWLEVHQPDAADVYSESVERRLTAGHQVNEIVHGLIPDGVLIGDEVNLADALRINAYPSLVFFDENGELIQALPGYKSAQELEIFLKMVASDDYKDITTEQAWADYQKAFKSTF